MQHFWHCIVFNCKRYPPPLLASKQKGSCQHSNLSITTLHYTLQQRTYKTKKIAKMSFKTHYHAHNTQEKVWWFECPNVPNVPIVKVDLNLSKSSAMAIDHSFQKKKECLIYNLKTVACQHNRWSSGGFYSRYVYGVLSKIYKGVSY